MTLIDEQSCPYCLRPMTPDTPLVVCSDCRQPHHRDCWEHGGHCRTIGCNGSPTEVSAVEETTQPQPTPIPMPPPPPPVPPSAGLLPPPIMVQSSPTSDGLFFPPECPPELRRWNWGAFSIPLFWTASMGLWLWFALCFIPYLGYIVHIIIGIRGSELAWKSRKWSSRSHFEETQQAWNKWGLALFVAWILIIIAVIVFAVFNNEFD